MEWFKKNKLRGLLPADSDVIEISVGPWNKVEIIAEKKLLSRRMARDLRMARLLSLADAIGRSKSLNDSENHFWFFRPTAHQARSMAVHDAVRRWAWTQWLENDFEVPGLLNRKRWPDELASLFGDINGLMAFQKPISFFEAELGILHLNFSVIAGEIDQKWYVGSFCGRDSDDPWLEVLNDWAWQHTVALDQAAEPGMETGEIQSLSKLNLGQVLAQRGKKIQWPGLRMQKVEVKALENDLGYFARATADGVARNKKSEQLLLLPAE